MSFESVDIISESIRNVRKTFVYRERRSLYTDNNTGLARFTKAQSYINRIVSRSW